MLNKIAISLPFFLALSLSAEIVELQSLETALVEIDQDTLVVLDIDNTVLMPTGILGSDQWYEYLVRKFEANKKLSSVEAQQKAEAVWNLVQPAIKMKTVEENTAQIIGLMQQKGAHVVALTTRSTEILEVTREQLVEQEIDFSKSAPQADSSFLVDGKAVLYKDGVLYQDRFTDRGNVVIEFMNNATIAPKKIIYIDDLFSGVIQVNDAFKTLPTAVITIEYRYGATDEQMVAFFEHLSWI